MPYYYKPMERKGNLSRLLVRLRDFVKAGFVSQKNSIFVVELERWMFYALIINCLDEIGWNFGGWMQEEDGRKVRIVMGVCEVRVEV